MNLRPVIHTVLRVLKRRRMPLGILAGSLLIMLLLTISTRRVELPTMMRDARRVKVMNLALSRQTAVVAGYGTIEPSRVLEVRPQVSGHVVRLHPQFIEGGRLEAGAEIFQIDPVDYKLALESSKAALTQAESNLRLEIGNQVIAKREWELFQKGAQKTDAQDDLALRVPQRQAMEAQLDSARNDVRRAELNLERTSVRSPFPALVLERNVVLGTFAMAGGAAAKIVSIDQFYVKLRLPDEALHWLIFDPASGDPSADNIVLVRHKLQDGREAVRRGSLEKVLGSVESTGRMAQLLISIDDPLKPEPNTPPLLIGLYVEVEIAGRTLEHVYKIPRGALHEGNKVYVADAKKLFRTRTPEVVLVRGDDVLVRDGFHAGDRLIVSAVDAPLEGMPLHWEEEQSGK